MHIVVSQTFQGEDVLDRRNFDTLTGAIQNLCKKEKSSEEKSWLKLALGCTLKKTIRVMKGYYTQINDTDRVTEVEQFHAVVSHTEGRHLHITCKDPNNSDSRVHCPASDLKGMTIYLNKPLSYEHGKRLAIPDRHSGSFLPMSNTCLYLYTCINVFC